MSLFYISVIAACSVIPALAASFFKQGYWNGKYMPLFILLWLGSLNDLVSYFFIRARSYSSINGNLFVLFEFLVVTWLFSRMDEKRSPRFFLIAICFGVGIWIADNLFLHTLLDNNSLFRMCASFLIVYMCIDRITPHIIFDQQQPFRETELLLASGFLVYHAYKTFVEAFHVFPTLMGRDFYEKLWVILNITNIIANILFTIAIVWLRQKLEFILR
jgi:hypothetical protein